MGELIPIIIVPVIFLVMGWMVRTVSVNRRLRETARMQTEMQTKLLEKFGTSQEMLQYLESEAGKKFVESASLERANPHGRILSGIQAGILLVLGSVAMFASSSNFDREGPAQVCSFLGLMGIMLGSGFLISSFVAYRLSKNWGLFGAERSEG